MTPTLILITTFYLLLVAFLIYGWKNVKVFRPRHKEPTHKFSIVIPYRDEANNLPHLLDSFLNLEYPYTHYEILLVNDASADNSRKICADFRNDHPYFNICLLENKRLTGAPKKDAINTAVSKAMFDHIITTDADCILPPYWLQAFDEMLEETGALLIAGPVRIYPGRQKQDAASNQRWERKRAARSKKHLYAFQEMDLMSLQAAGVGAFGLGRPFMANGANLCYSREAFIRVGRFQGNEKITSGDDVFLLQKFNKNGLRTGFLKCRDAVVLTRPQPDLTSLISQRIRWAAKTPAYHSMFAKATSLIVLLMNFSLIACTFLVFIEMMPYEPVLYAFLAKFLADLILLYLAAGFFRRKEILRNYFWSSLVYPFFSSAVAIMSLFRKFEWKGRP